MPQWRMYYVVDFQLVASLLAYHASGQVRSESAQITSNIRSQMVSTGTSPFDSLSSQHHGLCLVFPITPANQITQIELTQSQLSSKLSISRFSSSGSLPRPPRGSLPTRWYPPAPPKRRLIDVLPPRAQLQQVEVRIITVSCEQEVSLVDR